MDKLPQRDDLIYKEIEKFQDYELTNCISYEMAIRDSQLRINILNCFEEISVYVSSLINIKEEKTRKLLIELIENIFLNYNIDIRVHGNIKFLYSLHYISSNQKNMIDEICNYFIEKEDVNNTILEKYLEDEGLGFKEYSNYSGYSIKQNTFIKNLNKHSLNDIKDEVIIGNINKSDILFLPNFSRPIIPIDNRISRISRIELNLNIDVEELVSYIRYIKADLDNKNSFILKSPLEMIEYEFESNDNKRTPKKPKAFVYADWFYIYDYWKYEKTQGKTDKDIFVALEVENNVPYKEDMIRKIRDKMKYFIDDLGYKELITGVKNS
ncbi:hypothetical protein [Aliarcobacter butzleri]|uniref:hypothetical protein n=1 Tax=Aliarcobacter butzleri TaxID=28197 RepID=UPI003B225AEE